MRPICSTSSSRLSANSTCHGSRPSRQSSPRGDISLELSSGAATSGVTTATIGADISSLDELLLLDEELLDDELELLLDDEEELSSSLLEELLELDDEEELLELDELDEEELLDEESSLSSLEVESSDESSCPPWTA